MEGYLASCAAPQTVIIDSLGDEKEDHHSKAKPMTFLGNCTVATSITGSERSAIGPPLLDYEMTRSRKRSLWANGA